MDHFEKQSRQVKLECAPRQVVEQLKDGERHWHAEYLLVVVLGTLLSLSFVHFVSVVGAQPFGETLEQHGQYGFADRSVNFVRQRGRD